jgi:hypothetical protein
MSPDELMGLLSQGEGQRLEFKEDAIKPADLAQTLVGMANAQGGVVLLGVNDAGQPVGIHSYNDAYDLVMTAASHELYDPPIRLTKVSSVVLPDGIQVLAVSVPRSRKLHATHGRFMVRRGSQNVALTTAEVADRSRHVETGGLTPIPLGGGYHALYEVLRFEVTLELLDPQGETAVLEREQELRFLQDGVVGLYHQVWGEGELFDDYQVEPGIIADRFQLGSRHITLISLRQIKNRGDSLRLRIRRQVKRGWTQPEEWLETTVNHRTRFVRVRVVFPAARPPGHVAMTEEEAGSVQELDHRSWSVDDQGRTVIIWQKRAPALGETYLLRWSW